MPDPSRLRDSTQIVVPCDALDDVRQELESEFAVTVVASHDVTCRIIGSPVEIKGVSQFLSRRGITHP
jgi:hypothetical protein